MELNLVWILLAAVAVVAIALLLKRKPSGLPPPRPEETPEAPELPPAADSAAAPAAPSVPATAAAPAEALEPVSAPSPSPEPAPEQIPAQEEPAAPDYDGGFRKTRGLFARLKSILTGRPSIDPSIWEELEELLITADVGIKTTEALLSRIKAQKPKAPEAVRQGIRNGLLGILTSVQHPDNLHSGPKPRVVMIAGVNGVGKTTTIGKLAHRYRSEGFSVLLGAADTFRAAAVDQLDVWCKRVGAEIVRGKENSDPSGVAFDAAAKAKADQVDVLIIDTAGRLHTKTNLMEELKKTKRVIGKALEGAPHETWLVIDGTTGQNAINQVREFHNSLELTGLVVTKLDGTSKGGALISIVNEFKLPVRYIGIGERLADLTPFDPVRYIDEIFRESE